MSENIFQKFYKNEIRKIQRKFLKSSGGKRIIISDNVIATTPDLQSYFDHIRKTEPQNSKILITYYNHLWEPVLKMASVAGLRRSVGVQNWLDEQDLSEILNLSGFEVISSQKRVLLPFYVPIISNIFNKYIAGFPIVNGLCLISIIVARSKQRAKRNYSVSIIIPARNEEKNIAKIIPSIPRFGKSREYIFIEGHSTDGTWEEISRVSKKYKNVKVIKQKKTGKADAVKTGFSKASNEIFMIYDADRTVSGKDLLKFYDALSHGLGEFANGSRLVYPMEDQAMQTLNKIGNKAFSLIFSWILGQRFKDTLCGTKAFFRKDYLNFKHSKFDPFGDFDLIFGAIRENLKVVEIPVRYKEREYGSTNIKRFRHGLMLLKTALSAYREFKAW